MSYVPSGTFLARAGERPAASGNRLLAVGDTIFGKKAKTPTDLELPPGGVLVLQVAPRGAEGQATSSCNMERSKSIRFVLSLLRTGGFST